MTADGSLCVHKMVKWRDQELHIFIFVAVPIASEATINLYRNNHARQRASERFILVAEDGPDRRFFEWAPFLCSVIPELALNYPPCWPLNCLISYFLQFQHLNRNYYNSPFLVWIIFSTETVKSRYHRGINLILYDLWPMIG